MKRGIADLLSTWIGEKIGARWRAIRTMTSARKLKEQNMRPVEV
jgi:hypothetical protein